MKQAIQTKKEAWLHAVRLRTLPLALASIFAGSFLAVYREVFRWEILLLASLTTIFLQILSNLSNDYGDTIHGADHKDRQGPVRAVQSGLITLQEMKKGMYLFGTLALISGLALLFLAVQDWILFGIFLALGLAAIWASISYTSGNNPYGYAGLGDISVFLFFGLLGVYGTYFLHSLAWDNSIIWIGIALGLFSAAVLNINNIRDIESDTTAGKKSIPVRIGKKAAIIYNCFYHQRMDFSARTGYFPADDQNRNKCTERKRFSSHRSQLEENGSKYLSLGNSLWDRFSFFRKKLTHSLYLSSKMG